MASAAKAEITAASPLTSHIDTFARDHLPPGELWPEFKFTRPEFRRSLGRSGPWRGALYHQPGCQLQLS
jgi:hypothetical protein